MNSRAAVRFASALALAALASASQGAQRTFVASYGNDANSCNPINPCRSFTAAFARTDPSGEIIVLDSAGYGAVSINQALSIKAPPGVYAGISTASTDGITINAPGQRVSLQGLTINGISINSQAGVRVVDASIVTIDRCFIKGAVLAGAIQASTGTLYINDTTLEGNAGGGLMLSGDAVAHVDNSAIRNNSGWGVQLWDGAQATIARTFITDQQRGVEAASFSPGNPLQRLTISDSVVANNSVFGVQVLGNGGPGGMAWMDRTTLFANGGGGFNVQASGDTSSVAFATVRRTMAAGNGWGIRAGTFLNEAAVLAVTQSVAAGNAADGLGQKYGSMLETRQNNTVHGNNGGDANSQTIGTLTPLAPL